MFSWISFQFFLRCGAPSGLPKVRGLGPRPPGPPLKPPLNISFAIAIGNSGVGLMALRSHNFESNKMTCSNTSKYSKRDCMITRKS